MGGAASRREDGPESPRGYDDRSPPDSPLVTPRSPLTFGPQVPMAPMPQPTDFSLGGSGSHYNPDFPAVAWPTQPTLVPTPIVWSHGGNHVEVEGSFDNWTTRTIMHRNGKDFTVIKLMQPGVYQYKFIVDGEWKYAPEQPAMYDERGNVNNVVEVCEYTPENLDNLQSFAPPSSPPRSYDSAGPGADDFAKEPPTAPPQLHLTLLNVPPLSDAPNILPRPQHVILNHLYSDKSRHAKGAIVLGATHRYRSKYITCVLYKPGVAGAAAGGGAGGAAAAGGRGRAGGVADMHTT